MVMSQLHVEGICDALWVPQLTARSAAMYCSGALQAHVAVQYGWLYTYAFVCLCVCVCLYHVYNAVPSKTCCMG